MTLREQKTNGAITLGVSGKIQTKDSEELLNKLNSLIDQGEDHLLLDFSEVDYINSSGLRVLMTVAKKLSNLGGKMVLADVTELILQVLRVSGCASVIGIYPSSEEALKALKAK